MTALATLLMGCIRLNQADAASSLKLQFYIIFLIDSLKIHQLCAGFVWFACCHAKIGCRTLRTMTGFRRMSSVQFYGNLGRRTFTVASLILLIPFLLTGCYDRQELEQQAFVTALGIDKATPELYDFSFTIALPQNSSGLGGGQTGDQPLAAKGILTYRAHGLSEALLLANSSIERSLSLTHLDLVVFGETLTQTGISQMLRVIARNREFRGTVLAITAKGGSRALMAANQPFLDKSSARMIDSIAHVGEQTGIIPVTYLQDLLRDAQTSHVGSVVPLFAVNADVKQNPQGGGAPKKDKVFYKSGRVNRTGGNPVEWVGGVVLKDSKATCELSGKEVRNLMLMRGRLKMAQWETADPVSPGEYLGLTLHRERQPRYTVRLSNPLQISVEVPLEADLTQVSGDTNYSLPQYRLRLENVLSQQLSREMEELLTKVLNRQQADVIPISATVRRRFWTDGDFTSYPWEERLTNAHIQVHVSLAIRRYGLELASAHTRI
ncbi:Ger(x)C family spore germination protein [Alicyclobacillaceae bacterium I2511]|nr:Ger(x)C family spore germination protein [Alicyclobacillaceae bacterium I2511]